MAFGFLLLTTLTSVLITSPALAEDNPAGQGLDARVKHLYEQGDWNGVLSLTDTPEPGTADLCFYRGMAFARLLCWEEALICLRRGGQMAPRDPRFPTERAGAYFKLQKRKKAIQQLRQALGLAPHDAYLLDFMGTLQQLSGNLESALYYWNQIDKPQLRNFTIKPAIPLDPVLLDRALRFPPAGLLRLEDYHASRLRLARLSQLQQPRFELTPAPSGGMDLNLRARHQPGWRENPWINLLLTFRGLPGQAINPGFFNIHSSAWNTLTQFRFHAQRRRLYTVVEGPWHRDPAKILNFFLDGRRETWDFRAGAIPWPTPDNFRLHTDKGGAELRWLVRDRWDWKSALEFAHRSFQGFPADLPEAEVLFSRGNSFKYSGSLAGLLYSNVPGRLSLRGAVGQELARHWGTKDLLFGRTQADLHLSWLPQVEGDDYAVHVRLRAGAIEGAAPFDELFILGVERDSDLWLRAHAGTHRGKKGSGPLGKSFWLANSEIDKRVYRFSMGEIRLAPFMDSGKFFDSLPALHSPETYWDGGLILRLRSSLGFGLSVIYGRDLQTGHDSFYITFQGERSRE